MLICIYSYFIIGCSSNLRSACRFFTSALPLIIEVDSLKSHRAPQASEKSKVDGKAETSGVSKYERGEHSPSVEMATKIAEALEVSVDYLLSKERFGKYDKEAIKRLEGIQNMDETTRLKLFDIIDTYIHNAKTRQAYAG